MHTLLSSSTECLNKRISKGHFQHWLLRRHFRSQIPFMCFNAQIKPNAWDIPKKTVFDVEFDEPVESEPWYMNLHPTVDKGKSESGGIDFSSLSKYLTKSS